jgi:AraC-like DNA-binding protein
MAKLKCFPKPPQTIRDRHSYDPLPGGLPSVESSLDRQIEQTKIIPISGIEFQCTETWFQPRRILNDSMWYWIEEGSGRGWIGDPTNEYRLNPGDIFIIPAGMPHETWPDKDVRIKTVTVHFHARVNGNRDLLALLGILGAFPADPRAPYAEGSRNIAREFALKAPGWRWAMSAAIQQVLLYIIRYQGGRLNLPNLALHNERLHLQPAIELVRNRLHDPELTVADLAETIFVSEVYLRKLFRKTVKATPVEFITHRRIEKAQYLLKTTDLNIKAITQQCGFRDIPFFYRVFRKITKLTPVQYRRSYK